MVFVFLDWTKQTSQTLSRPGGAVGSRAQIFVLALLPVLFPCCNSFMSREL